MSERNYGLTPSDLPALEGWQEDALAEQRKAERTREEQAEVDAEIRRLRCALGDVNRATFRRSESGADADDILDEIERIATAALGEQWT